jgi:hypothetical protein
MSGQTVLGFFHNLRRGHAALKLVEALQPEAATYKLEVGMELRMEIPFQIGQSG